MPVVIVIVAAALTGLIIAQIATKVQVRAVVSGLMVHAGVWMSYTATRILPDIAGFFAKTLLQAFQATGPTMASVAAALLTEITGEEVPPEAVRKLQGSGSILDAGNVLAERFLPQITAALFPDRTLSPEEAAAAATRLLGVGLSFSVDSWSDHTILELTSLGQLSWAADLSEAVASGLGLTRVTRRAMQAIFGRAIQPGLEAHLNTLYRPERLKASEAIDAWQQGLLDDDGALRALGEAGYSYELAALLLNVRQRDFTSADVEALLRDGLVDEEFVGRWTRRQGFGAERADLMTARLLGNRARGIQEDLADTARRVYRAGVLDDEELRAVLGQVGYRDPEIDLVLVREALELRNEKQLSLSQVLGAYQEGIFDVGEARDRLRLLRYTDDSIDVLLATQTKRLSPAQVIDALTRGIVTEAAARERLEQQGYRREDIDVLLDLRVRRLTSGQVLDALTRGLLNPQDARRLLEQLGFTAEVTDLLLAFQARKLSPADITAALLRGIIAEPEALNRLLSLGYSREDALVLLQLRFQLLSTGQILDAYDAGLVGRASTRTRLQQLGFLEADAELLVGTFEGKRIREGKPPSPP